MRRLGKFGSALVLAATLTIGCGGGSSDKIIAVITQGDVETCLTDATFLLLILSDKLDDILAEIDGNDLPDITVTNPSGNTWTFDCTFSIAGPGNADTQIAGTVILPDADISPGDLLQVDNVVITSLGGPITGNADVDVLIEDGFIVITGDVNLRDSSADCEMELSMPDGFTINDSFRVVRQRRPAADLGGLMIDGKIDFSFDFGLGIEGSMVISDSSQNVTVMTDLFDDFTFQLFPDNETFQMLFPCLLDFSDTVDTLASALADVIDEATGESDSGDVEINGTSFVYDDGFTVIDGTVSLTPPSLIFLFSNGAGYQGQSDGPITLTLPAPGGTGTVNGSIMLGSVESSCAGTFTFVNTRFDDEDFEDFIGGRTKLVVTLDGDSIELNVDESADENGGAGDDELAGVTVLINEVTLPPIAIAYLLFSFSR